MSQLKVVAFDLFGTVFDLRGTPREEVQAYAEHIRRPEWSPLQLPEWWTHLPPFPDSSCGIDLLRRKFVVVTCSNAPLGMQIRMAKNGDVQFDGFIPLELNRVFKTNPKAYMTICEVMNVRPDEVLMVTANEKFGDIEAAGALGMRAKLIRGTSPIQDIVMLARELENE